MSDASPASSVTFERESTRGAWARAAAMVGAGALAVIVIAAGVGAPAWLAGLIILAIVALIVGRWRARMAWGDRVIVERDALTTQARGQARYRVPAAALTDKRIGEQAIHLRWRDESGVTRALTLDRASFSAPNWLVLRATLSGFGEAPAPVPTPRDTADPIRVAADATVHDSPFATLAIPVCDTPLSPTMIQRWVEPIYLGLDQASAAAFVANNLARVDDAVIDRLLADRGWRSRVAGATLVALTRRHAFVPRIGQLLLRSDVCFAGIAYCQVLAQCASDEAIATLHRYLGFYLTRADLDFDQGMAMAALAFIGAARGEDLLAPHREAWSSFAANHSGRDLDKFIAHFNARMARLAALQAKSPAPR